MEFLRKLQLITIVSFLFFGCTKNEKDFGPRSVGGNAVNLPEAQRVIIGNEGNFQWGNGSLSVYDPNKKSISNNVYKALNNLPLGDVVQSINKRGNELYVVVNNSGKIEVLDEKTMIKKRTLKLEGRSPRYIEFLSDDRAFVTDLYAGEVLMLNPQTGEYLATYKTKGWTEKMLSNETYVFIEARGGKQILVYDKKQNTWLKAIDLQDEPLGVFTTKEHQTYAYDDKKLYELKFEQSHFFAEIKYELPDKMKFGTGAFNTETNELFYVFEGVNKMSVSDVLINKVLRSEGRVFYGISIDAKTGEVYVTDAKDYVQNGTLYRISPEGNILDQQETGIIPQFIYVDR